MEDGKGFIQRLKKRWGITSTAQVVVILVVFACTGFSVLYVEELLFVWIGVPADRSWWVALLLFLFITLPLYNLLLLFFGLLFGQFRFFWNFEKRFFGRIFGRRNNQQ
jgi:hypothetical protein